MVQNPQTTILRAILGGLKWDQDTLRPMGNVTRKSSASAAMRNKSWGAKSHDLTQSWKVRPKTLKKNSKQKDIWTLKYKTLEMKIEHVECRNVHKK